jgi:phosphoadenosine phosphosulfate reductase
MLFYEEKVKRSLEILKSFETLEGYYLAFSGGKDSIVIYDLAKKAGVKFDAHYRCVGFDPPELVRFVKTFKDVYFEINEKNVWKQFVKKGVPTRLIRWCCDHKESGGSGRVVVTGVRSEESRSRAKRKIVEFCYKDTTKRFVNPIIDWSSEEVWRYIKENGLPYCDLYDKGFERIGCIACPLTSKKKRKFELEKYPAFEKLYRVFCQKAFDYKKSRGNKMPENWTSGADMFNWWHGEEKDIYEQDNDQYNNGNYQMWD